MSEFDTIVGGENKFVKHNAGFLETMFGTTDLTPLWIADMDFKVAPAITKELERIVDRGNYAYEMNAIGAFKAISKWNHERHRLSLSSKNFIMVPSVLTGIAVLLQELTEKGDGIVVQTPVYHQFYKVITMNQRNVVKSPLKLVEDRYEMDFDDLELKFQQDGVKLFLLCNPHNPVGRVWSKEELSRLISLAETYDIRILSDEIHSDIVYSGNTFTSIASFNSDKHITIIGSPAKTFGMHSIANGFLYIPNKKVKEKVNDLVEAMYLHHGNTFSTFATIAAYTEGGKWVDDLVSYLAETNNCIEKFLNDELPQLKMIIPEGTYQTWIDFSALKLSKEELETLIFKKAKLGLAPGSWFGEESEQFMRINIASPRSVIKEAFKVLKHEIDLL